jgi:hypothetical protein
VEVSRPYYLCPDCHAGQFPADAERDIENTEFSPGVRRMQALVGQEAPFDHGREQMKVLAGLEVTAKSVERAAEGIGAPVAQREQKEMHKALQLDLPVAGGEPLPILYVQMDGTGVPVVKKETLGRQGKIAGQPAHTREVKLGCVFTQTTWDQKGYPLRAPASTTYTGAIESAEEFGRRLYGEAWKRGWSRALLRVVMGDGAEWIWNLATLHFPGALHIVDLYHARQHLWELARQLYPHDPAKLKAWIKVHQKRLLDKGKIEKLVGMLRALPSRHRGEDPHGSRLFRKERRAHALPQVPPPTPLCGLGRHRGRMQNRGRFSPETFGNVLDRAGSQRHPGPALCLSQWRFEDYWESRRAAIAA